MSYMMSSVPYHNNESPVKRRRRPNVTYPFDQAPLDKENYKRCEVHQLYSLHTCPQCVIAKREATMVQRHGVRSALLSKDIMNKKNATSLERYNVLIPTQAKEIKEKIAATNIKKYGAVCSLQNKNVKKKALVTMVERYGVEHSCQVQETLDKRVKTYQERYGTDNPLQNKAILKKRKETNRERYGTDEVLKNKEIQERIRQTMIDKYDSHIPLQNKEIKAKKDATCERLYGNSVIMHVPELFEKKTVNAFARKPFTLPSGKVIHYQGYEDVALRELLEIFSEDEIVNDVKEMPSIMYDFHGKTCKYYPDIFIPSQNKFIEIKSTYTYEFQQEKNNCKRDAVLRLGYEFEFWICSKDEILIKTMGWGMGEPSPLSKGVIAIEEELLESDSE
jgi:hypothetical protein